MCGRFTNLLTWGDLVALYGLSGAKPPASNLEPRYNLAPTQRVVRLNAEGAREATVMRWGLIPSWALPKHYDS